ncbi:hypothetical protein [Bartonella birtlesii]|uniref:hypothetical protein n=1 Tax=Bartonella birtlesii TaxID=111504 RepID=UPI0012DBE0A0|nr:hypothetical protein [Bartonella birtlesii]
MILWDDNDFASVRNGILGVLMGWILRVWPMLLLWNKESRRLGGDLGGGALARGSVKSGGAWQKTVCMCFTDKVLKKGEITNHANYCGLYSGNRRMAKSTQWIDYCFFV